MARKLRVEYPGAMYHVLSHGAQREEIFRNIIDRHDFVKSLSEACQKTGWQFHAFLRANLRTDPIDRLETAQSKADRIVAQELARLKWTETELAARPKGDGMKLALAARLRQETTLSVKEIAERLHLGKPKGARSNLHKFMTNPRAEAAQAQLNM